MLRFGQFEEKLLLDVVRVLILVHHDVLDAAREGTAEVGVKEEIMDQLLLMGEVESIALIEAFFVGLVGSTDLAQKRGCCL